MEQKGGVGKSTIAFHVASRYAELNPDRHVLVIDLCPQANVSMLLLGGGIQGENAVLEYCTQPTPRTVVGYLSQVISGGSGAPLPPPMNFIVQVSQTNQDLPQNLYLLCGDGNLEPMAPAISGAAAAPPLIPGAQPWRWIHLIFRELIQNIVGLEADHDWIVFVSSRVATSAMFILLHGQHPPHPIYGTWTYAAKSHRRSRE